MNRLANKRPTSNAAGAFASFSAVNRNVAPTAYMSRPVWLRGRRHNANNPVAMKLGANTPPATIWNALSVS